MNVIRQFDKEYRRETDSARNERSKRIDALFWENLISRFEAFSRDKIKRTNLGTQMGSRRVKRARGAREPLSLYLPQMFNERTVGSKKIFVYYFREFDFFF